MNLLILGATGLVGHNLIKLLNDSNMHFENVIFVASSKSKNKIIYYKNIQYKIKLFEDVDLSKIDVCCIVSNSEISSKYFNILLENKIIIIDNSSAFRHLYKLTIPEINYRENEFVYINPNCCVIPTILSLNEIHKELNITKLIINTYQSCSGGGYELLNNLLNNQFKKCIPQIGNKYDYDNSSEEKKIIYEINKILNSNINIISNTVRVPVDIGHLINIHFKTKKQCTESQIMALLQHNTIYIEDISNINLKENSNIYTTCLKKINTNTYSFYCYSNNLLRGSSYNTFLILKNILNLPLNNLNKMI